MACKGSSSAFLRMAVCLLVPLSPARAQEAPDSPRDTTVVPGSQYGAGTFARLLLGEGYRDLWLTPLRVPVLQIDTLGEGVAPLRSGGGFSTRTLHLEAADGTRWQLRSVDKTPSRSVPGPLRETVFSKAVDTQVMSYFPAAPLAVPPLLEAVGVLHVRPELVSVGDTDALGEYRPDFGGMLAMLEIRPNDAPGGEPGFAGSRRVDSTVEMFDAVRARADRDIDAEEFLRARLVDLVIGDRDRAIDNWRWARFDVEGGQRYRPIPRDRDQAFVRFDGAVKWAARWFEPRLVRFRADYGSVLGLTRNAWDLDRRFLSGIDRERWLEVTRQVQEALTDSVVDTAVSGLPPEIRASVGDELSRVLRARVRDLPRASVDFYRIVSEYADVWGSDQPDRATITGMPDGAVEVVLTHTPAGGSPSVYWARRFRPEETREIRLYLLDGADTVRVDGLVPNSPHIRIVGGDGADHVVGPIGEGRATLYEIDAPPPGGASRGLEVRRVDVPPPVAWGDSATARDWGGRTYPVVTARVGADVGLVVGAGVDARRFGFRTAPYRERIRATAGYALAVEDGYARVEYERHRPGGALSFRAWADASGLERLRFFGFGNDTESAMQSEFYRVRHRRLVLGGSVVRRIDPKWTLRAGPSVTVAHTDTVGTSSFLAIAQPYGSGRFARAGVSAALIRDTRVATSVLAPGTVPTTETARSTSVSGSRIRVEGALFPAVLDVGPSAFGWLEGEVVSHVSPFGTRGWRPTLVTVAGARKVLGRAPAFEAAYLGGRRTLRGFQRERFAGDASLFGTVEARMPVGSVLAGTLPTDVGVIGFLDVGRVYVDGRSPGGFHSSWGAGVWFAPLERAFTVRALVARSVERTNLQVGTGFPF